jgi:hypothetical protein
MPKPSIGPHGRVQLAQHVSCKQLQEDWVLLDLRRGSYFGLDEIGGRIWKGLTEDHLCPADIANQMAPSYPDEPTLLQDIIAFADELIEKGLVSEVAG